MSAGLETTFMVFMLVVTARSLISPSFTLSTNRTQRLRRLHHFGRETSGFSWHHSPRPDGNRCSRVRLRREDLPEGTRRELEEAERRIRSLEEEYWKSLAPGEAAAERKCATGLALLQIGMLEQAAEEYESAADIRPPDARSWPLGLVLFYLGRYDEAIARLERDIRSFEKRFEESATDERIWQAAAKIRGARAVGEDVARVAGGLPQLPIPEPNAMRRTVYELFRGETSLDQVRNAAELATDGVDHLGLAFFSEVFQGLWHDAHGNEEAKAHVLAASRINYPQPDDLWYHTPRIHARARGWKLSEQL